MLILHYFSSTDAILFFCSTLVLLVNAKLAYDIINVAGDPKVPERPPRCYPVSHRTKKIRT